MATTQTVTLGGLPSSARAYRELYEAAGRMLRWYDDNVEVEDVTDEMAGLLTDLRAVLARHDTVPG